MKKYLVIFFVTILTFPVKGQNGKKISGIVTTLNRQHPDEFLLEDESISIKFKKGTSTTASFEIYNKSDKSVDFLWNDSYFVLNGESFPVKNGGISPIKMHTMQNEIVDVNKSIKIGPKSKYSAILASEDKYIFNQSDAYYYYNSNNKQLINRIVPVILVESKKQEYPISVELWTKKNLKDLNSK